VDANDAHLSPTPPFYQKEGLLMNVNATSSDAVVAAIKEKCGIA
jgi:adenylate kinase